MSIAFEEFDIEKLRQRLMKMTDEELVLQGQAAKSMCSPEANFGKPPLQVFVATLREARAEWQRRHPKTPPRCPAPNTSHIFSDESSQQGQQFFVLGALYFWRPNADCENTISTLEKEMNELKLGYGLHTLKWEDVPKPSLRLNGYKALVKYLADQKSLIKFKCMVVDTVAHPLKSKEYNDGDRLLGYLKYYTVFLTNGIMLAQRGYFYDITIDNYSFKPGTEYDPHHLGECVEYRYVRTSKKKPLKQRHGQLTTANDEDSNLIQMADLLTGAVAFCWNGGLDRTSGVSIGRKELVAVIRNNYGGVKLDRNSKPMGPFVIWKFTNSEQEDSPSPTAPGEVRSFP